MFGNIKLTKDQYKELYEYLDKAITEEPTECPKISLNFPDKSGRSYCFKMMFPLVLP